MFITFEGLDGSGKTTQLNRLADTLRAQGYPVFKTREPGGTSIGDQVRQVLHDLKNENMHPHTEILLYAASRAQLVAEVIRPRLAKGEIVLCDRYADSTLAYQGYGHHLDLPTLRTILDFATGGLKPAFTLYLDLTAEQGVARRQRAAQAGEEWNRMDAQSLAFYQRVRQGYMTLIDAEPERWVCIPAAGDPDTIQQQVYAAVMERLPTLQG